MLTLFFSVSYIVFLTASSTIHLNTDLDASGFGAPGLISFYLSDFGNYDQCLAIDGKYCLAHISLPKSESIKDPRGTLMDMFKESEDLMQLTQFINALCLPKACSSQLLQVALNQRRYYTI